MESDTIKEGNYTKRMFHIAFNTLMTSGGPILMWVLIGVWTGNGDTIAVFSITYPLQFFISLQVSIFASGNLICRSKGEGSTDQVCSGIWTASIVTAVAATILICNIDKYMVFFGAGTDYTELVEYSIRNLLCTTVVLLVAEMQYYNNKDARATKFILTYNIINIAVMCVAVNITELNTALVLTNIATTCYAAWLLVTQLPKFRFIFTFGIFKGAKYRVSSISSNISMAIIYLFGLRNVFHYSIEFALAVSFVSLITDTQWDMLSGGVAVVSATCISSGEAIVKELVRSARTFGSVLAASSLLLGSLLYPLYAPAMQYAAILFTGELIDMLLYPRLTVYNEWCNIEYRPDGLATGVIIIRCIRIILSLWLPTMYALIIAQLVSGVSQYIMYWAIYISGQKRCTAAT